MLTDYMKGCPWGTLVLLQIDSVIERHEEYYDQKRAEEKYIYTFILQ